MKEFYSSADAFIDFRNDLRTKINVAIQEFGNAEAVSGMTSSVLPADALDKSKLISLTQRLGVHQSTRQSRPTKKTKQQKPKKFAKSYLLVPFMKHQETVIHESTHSVCI